MVVRCHVEIDLYFTRSVFDTKLGLNKIMIKDVSLKGHHV